MFCGPFVMVSSCDVFCKSWIYHLVFLLPGGSLQIHLPKQIPQVSSGKCQQQRGKSEGQPSYKPDPEGSLHLQAGNSALLARLLPAVDLLKSRYGRR